MFACNEMQDMKHLQNIFLYFPWTVLKKHDSNWITKAGQYFHCIYSEDDQMASDASHQMIIKWWNVDPFQLIFNTITYFRTVSSNVIETKHSNHSLEYYLYLISKEYTCRIVECIFKYLLILTGQQTLRVTVQRWLVVHISNVSQVKYVDSVTRLTSQHKWLVMSWWIITDTICEW